MTSFSRLNINLLQLKPKRSSENAQHLYIDGDGRTSNEKISSVEYNKLLQLKEVDEELSIQWCNNYTVLSIYSMKKTFSRKTLYIHFPQPLLNKNFTAVAYQSNNGCNSLCFDLILKDGIFINISLPIDFIISKNPRDEYPDNWLKVLNAYDFSVRPPQCLFHVNDEFSVVFLKDGGLLGLKRIPLEVLNDFELQPVLFNDSSYFQSFTRMFSRYDNHNSAVVSAELLNERYLVTLTNDATIKIWDLITYQLSVHFDLKEKNKQVNYGVVGKYMAIRENLLIVYIPAGNGSFQIIQLQNDPSAKINFKPLNVNIPVNLSSYTVWSLIDIELIRSSSIEQPELNLVLLWKSNTVTKLQLLSFQDSSFNNYNWIDCNNTYLPDLMEDSDLLTNGNMEKSLLNLKAHYSQSTYIDAQSILNQNNVVIQMNDLQNQEYLTNLEALLKELHKQYQEPSTLTVIGDGIVVINSLQMYHHSTYKLDSKLESIFFKISERKEPSTQLESFLNVLHGFSTTISSDTLIKVSAKFLDLVNGSIDPALSLKEKMTVVFQDCLLNGFQSVNLSKLLENLNSIDVLEVLSDFITGDLNIRSSSVIDLLDTDVFSSVISMESLKQTLLVMDKFIMDILLVFTIVDINYEMFTEKLNVLMELHFNISLWIQVYQIDKALAISEIFKYTSKYGHGVQLGSYEDVTNYTTLMVDTVRSFSINEPPLLTKAFCEFILNNDDLTYANQFLHYVARPYHISNNPIEELLYALSLLKCAEYDTSMEIFFKHDFSDELYLPKCLEVPEDHVWHSLFRTIGSKDKSAYYYELSVLYSKASSYANALQTIKKSISLDGSRAHHLLQYIDTLIVFGDYNEVLDVLRLEQELLETELREKYYKRMLTDQKCSEMFTATLFQSCYEANVSNDSILLSVTDYKIIASILLSQVTLSNWNSYKKLFSFRILNQHERKACEVLFDYVLFGPDNEVKEKSLLLISNVLKTFSDASDQWFISSTGQIIHLYELDSKLNK
ncbi:unnamed protein product [Kluyveromyces dobzhanskii CBS 2104]|uniref:WGS project CCBQ000000000 data, contig 00015 n=1 Tax=Kluyveromyces dobzhanskii CBS 2104 TaxID=1427455 RepID=A0A0A8LB47_9SACH|nr:unnamed protein product [Kluyveromyces dobzhanskii CBS 2104]